jgi:hypothetical protein
VRVADTVQPEQAHRAGTWQCSQQVFEFKHARRQHLQHHALMVAAAADALELLVLDHAIAESMGHAEGQDLAQRADSGFRQVDLAQRAGARGKRGAGGVQAADSLFGVGARTHGACSSVVRRCKRSVRALRAAASFALPGPRALGRLRFAPSIGARRSARHVAGLALRRGARIAPAVFTAR